MKYNYEKELEKINKYLERDNEKNKNNPLLNENGTRLSRVERLENKNKKNNSKVKYWNNDCLWMKEPSTLWLIVSQHKK